MSTKIYNGYKFDKDYSLRELDNLLTGVRKPIRVQVLKDFFGQILREFVFVYDCYCTFGEDAVVKRMKNFENVEVKTPIKWSVIFFEIANFFEHKKNEAEKSSYRNPFFDFTCEVHILPIKDKILFLYYGEKRELQEILESFPFVQEYIFQNQTDKPDEISDEEWEQREKDWEDAIIDYVPANHGFTVKLAPAYIPFISEELLAEVKPYMDSLNERVQYVFTSKLGTAEKNDIEKKLIEINSWQDAWNLFLNL